MRLTLTTLALLINVLLTAQAPALIPYQGAARNGAGLPLTNASLNARFTIHNQSVDGPSVWQEEQIVSTNSLGLFTAQLGNTTSLNAVNWANGRKFLQVELDLGSGYIEIGTQQMLSVPYALHAGSVRLDVSPTGDTLFVGDGSFAIIPGLSEANGYSSGITLHTCGTPNVHNAERTYGTMTDQEGNTYRTIAIGSQVWMAENLRTSTYRNGDVITTNLTNTEWQNTSSGAWSYHSNNESNECPYGKLYNWYACVDSRQVCPVGWHLPSDAEWTILTESVGGISVAGGKMKTVGTYDTSTGLWFSPNEGGDNSSGFSGVPGGARAAIGQYNGLTQFGSWWSSTPASATRAWRHTLDFWTVAAGRLDADKRVGFSVRCLRD